MEQSDRPVIRALENGPYVIQGAVRLLDADGNVWDIADKPSISLCRCGGSENKPFCDGTHKEIGFDAKERAPNEENEEPEGNP